MARSRQQREARESRDRLKRYTARQRVHEVQTRRRLRDNIVAIAGVLVVGALAGATQVVYFTAGPGAPTPAPSTSPTATGQNVGAPPASLAEYRTWTGELVLNDDVTLSIELDGAAAPQAVSGFIQDARDDYYAGKNCHRMADTASFSFLQCGSIDGAGSPDPDFSYGPIENAPADNLYPAGTIAMARSGGDAYSNGHQFFIVVEDTTLGADSAGGYTVVGHVTGGMDDFRAAIFDKGIDPDTVSERDGTGFPAVPTTITSVTLD